MHSRALDSTPWRLVSSDSRVDLVVNTEDRIPRGALA